MDQLCFKYLATESISVNISFKTYRYNTLINKNRPEISIERSVKRISIIMLNRVKVEKVKFAKKPWFWHNTAVPLSQLTTGQHTPPTVCQLGQQVTPGSLHTCSTVFMWVLTYSIIVHYWSAHATHCVPAGIPFIHPAAIAGHQRTLSVCKVKWFFFFWSKKVFFVSIGSKNDFSLISGEIGSVSHVFRLFTKIQFFFLLLFTSNWFTSLQQIYFCLEAKRREDLFFFKIKKRFIFDSKKTFFALFGYTTLLNTFRRYSSEGCSLAKRGCKWYQLISL